MCSAQLISFAWLEGWLLGSRAQWGAGRLVKCARRGGGCWAVRARRKAGLEPGISLQKYYANTRELTSLFSWPPQRAPCYVFFIETDPTRHIVLCLVLAARTPARIIW